MTNTAGQIVRFGLVGATATATHLIVALSLIAAEVHPLWANAWAFVISFQVSFFGHRNITFRGTAQPLKASALRFIGASLCGFGTSEALLAVLLIWTELPENVSLVIALGTVAVLTYLLGRFWIFVPPAPASGSGNLYRRNH